MPTQPDLFTEQVVTSVESSILAWIARSFASMEDWKRIGRQTFIALNGDSATTRNRLAACLRTHFTESDLHTEEVRRWKLDGREQESVKVDPPRLSAVGAAYIDWTYVADYILLACASPNEAIEAENTLRDAEYRAAMDSFLIRRTVQAARELIQTGSKLSEVELLAKLKEEFPDTAMAHVKEAMRLQRAGVKSAKLVEPIPSKSIERYQSVHF